MEEIGVDHSTIEPLNRVFLQLGPITIYWYAVFIMSGVALGLFLAIREGKKMGINSEFFYDLVSFGFISSFTFFISDLFTFCYCIFTN